MGEVRRLHAAGRRDGHRQPPARPDGAVRARRDELRGRHRAAVRLRPAARTGLDVTEHGAVFTTDALDADRCTSCASPTTSGWPQVRVERAATCTLSLDLTAGRRRGAWCWSRPPTGRRARSGSPSSSSCSTRPSRSGGRGWPGRTLHRPLAGGAAALGDHAEADDLRPDRRPGGRADRRPARAGRRRAQLGLPLHLGPRRLVLGLRPAAAGLHRGGGRVQPAGCATGSTSRSAATAAR